MSEETSVFHVKQEESVMFRSVLLTMAVSLVLCLAFPALGTVTEGPFVDYRGGVTASPPPGARFVIIDTDTMFVRRGRLFKDHLTIGVDDEGPFLEWQSWLARLAGVGYVTAQTPDDTGTLLVTTVYGAEQIPPRPELMMTGFPADPAFDQTVSFMGEVFVGASGTTYPGTPLLPLTVAELPARFPDFDLALFAGADPASRVFAFQTTIPASDLEVIPEPATLMLLSVGGLAVLRRKRR
jgi:hypothetical protein